MRHNHAAGFADRCCNGLPVVRTESAKVDQLHADSLLALDLLGCLQRAWDDCAVGNDGQVAAFFDGLRFAERDHIVRPRIRRAAIGLAIETFMLQEQYGIVAADRRAQQTVCVQRIRRKADAQPGNMREDAFAALRVIDRAAGQVSANGNAHDRRRGKFSVGAPANQRQLVAQLLHRGPDVIEELYFDHRFESAFGHAYGASHDVGFGERRVEHTITAVLHLQARGQFEYSAFAFDLFLFEILFAAAISHVFAKDHDAFVTPHLVFQADIDQIGHGPVRAFRLRLRRHLARI